MLNLSLIGESISGQNLIDQRASKLDQWSQHSSKMVAFVGIPQSVWNLLCGRQTVILAGEIHQVPGILFIYLFFF